MAEWIEPKVDWVTNPKNPRAEDFNRIEGNIQFLKEDIENKKGIIIGALEDVGLSVDEVSTFAEIADAIINANQGKKIITPGTSNITIPKGFHNGEGYVVGDSNLIASNIKQGVSIFGVLGTLKDGTNMKNVAFGRQTSFSTNLTVNNLTFTPKFILIHKISTNNPPRGYWDIAVYSNGNSPFANQNIRYETSDFPIRKDSNYNEWFDNATVTQYFSGNKVIQVTDNGFTISDVSSTSSYPVYWVAIG